MANIVNAGIIVLLAAFGLVAVMGAADELRPQATSQGGFSGPEDASAAGAEDQGLLDVDKPALDKALDDDRHERGRGDRDDDRNHGDKGAKEEKGEKDDSGEGDDGSEEDDEDDEDDR